MVNKTKHLTLNSQTWHTVKPTVCGTFRPTASRWKLPVVPGVTVSVVPLHQQARTVRRSEPHDWSGLLDDYQPADKRWQADYQEQQTEPQHSFIQSFISLFYSLLSFIIRTEPNLLGLSIIIILIIKAMIIILTIVAFVFIINTFFTVPHEMHV